MLVRLANIRGNKNIALINHIRWKINQFQSEEKLRNYIIKKLEEPENEKDSLVPLSEFSAEKLRSALIKGKYELNKCYVFDKDGFEHEKIF